MGLPKEALKERRRRELWDAQRGICPYCGKPLKLEAVSFDHVFPRSVEPWRGHTGNLLGSHRVPCNLRKSNRMPHPCEVIFLEAVNLRLGVTLRIKPRCRKVKLPTAEERAAQSAADKARHMAKKAAEQDGPTKPLRGWPRRPAVLTMLDDAFAAIGEGYRRGRI